MALESPVKEFECPTEGLFLGPPLLRVLSAFHKDTYHKGTLSAYHSVGGEVRIHPENARNGGRHGVQYVAQCVACAALTLDVWQ